MWWKFLFVCVVVVSVNAEEPIYKVVKVQVENERQVQAIQELEENHHIDLWTENGPSKEFSMFSLPESEYQSVMSELQTEGMKPITVIEDFQSIITKEKEENMPRLTETGGLGSFNHSRYLGIKEMYSYLKYIANRRSRVAKIISIGSTFEGRQILGVQITSGKFGSKPVIFLECGIHAREWASPATCLFIIDQLSDISNSETKELLKKYEWYIIPSTNPDGYEYTRSGTEMARIWRKTRSINRFSTPPECIGVDPNRNFDSNFGGVGTSDNPCNHQTYCGDRPFSEKETKALRDTIRHLGSRIAAYFAIHSYSQLWMYPYGYKNESAHNDDQLYKLSIIAVEAIREVHGTDFKYGSIAQAIDYSSGSSVDWVYEKAGVNIAFAIELRPPQPSKDGFNLPKEQILPTGEETFAGIKAVVNAL